MSASLPNFDQAKVLVIGDIMLDRYWFGNTSRISPEAPVPVVNVTDTENRLGGAGNVALNLSTLGCNTTLCGIVGDDREGQIARELTTKAGIGHQLIIDKNNPTITKLRILSRHQQLLRLDFEEKLHNTPKNELLSSIERILPEVNSVVISDYDKGTVHDSQAIIQLCKRYNVKILIDPKGKDYERYQGATLLTPNLRELEVIVGSCATTEIAINKAEELRQKLNVEAILLTLSEKGMALIQKDKAPTQIPTQARDVFDVTGAGDTVIATMAACLASDTDAQTAMRLANLAAGVVVGKLGTSTVNKNELQTAIAAQDNDLIRGAVDLETLKQQVQLAKQKGERIVFTNGCFDILHSGHVSYLQQASQLGDKLVVGLNSDASISRLKGASRPIVPLDERLLVMGSLNCVDWVVDFDEDTPLNLIEHILPDILCKGGDYIVEDIVGYNCVTGNGGEVKTLPFVQGRSTSSIIKKIQALESE
ncbi:MAG: bifunctional heptose 7-phosphate kinase/heptose 1-phosphate adenyltransferase [Alteromonadaceae bacterium]|nr:MAG: bifunctional heptose 7-phosphate kinase/heptose 1-phosphate adenyltransferase [Alteromonadaceae bacterium]